MGIRDDLKAIPRRAATFNAWKLTADPEELAAIEAAASDVSIPVALIVEACKRNGIPISKDTVRLYR